MTIPESPCLAPADKMTFWQRASFTLKLFLVGFLILLFFIPMSIVEDIIRDRQYYRSDAVHSIEQGWAAQQRLSGPALIIPCTRTYDVQFVNKDTGKVVTEKRTQEEPLYILPTSLEAKTDIQTQERKRGLYGVPVYTAAVDMKGAFGSLSIPEGLVCKTPYFVLGLSDARGIGQSLTMTLDGKTLLPVAGPRFAGFKEGVHWPIALEEAQKGGDFTLGLSLKGTQGLSLVPAAHAVKWSATSSWPHPSFQGAFLPSSREVGDKGFSAMWETNILATNIAEKFKRCAVGNCSAFENAEFTVNLFQSVDVYQQTNRAVKYAMLFIVLVFGAFFVFEAMKAMRIHPVQYALVGGALCLFYILLLALSEHIEFGLAYAAATATICALLGYYVAHVLRSASTGLTLAAVVAALYGALYFILQAEDYALLIGSGLLLGVLAAAMFATRHLDWYSIGSKKQ